MTIEEWTKDFKSYVTWLDMPRDDYKGIMGYIDDAIDLLKEQEPKRGKWVKRLSSCPSAISVGGSRTSACTICGGWGRKTFKYCPHCGAKMEKQEVKADD